MITGKMMMKILCWNFEKSFLKWEKMASRKIFRHFLSVNFFMLILLISNHTVFLVQFGVNLHLWVFQKAEITLAEAARAISAFWKTRSCKLIPNWTRNRMISYTNTVWKVSSHKIEVNNPGKLYPIVGHIYCIYCVLSRPCKGSKHYNNVTTE